MDKLKNVLITDYQIYLFKTGNNFNSHELLGAHPAIVKSISGFRFAVWAPDATTVSVVGDFNGWDATLGEMENINNSGIWYAFIPNALENMNYKYQIKTKKGEVLLKIDPYAFRSELPPKTASVTTNLNKYKWEDQNYMLARDKNSAISSAINIYEVHLSSWRRNADEKVLTYRELADSLLGYVLEMGYTHIELLPMSEYPFDGSWGYQATGYYCVTSRYGVPEDFMYFVDKCHQNNIGVIIDWVPSHFPKDSHALARYDGSALYEYEDSRIGEHLEWGTLVFNYRRHEVICFLISNVIFLLDKYHIDGIRVDAVSSMIYLNYGREGNHLLNCEGGIVNLDAINFLKKLNEVVNKNFPHTIMIAEEATSYPMITKSTNLGGLGFDFKWNMGWMNDILKYMKQDTIQRKHHHNLITFSMMYAFSEKYIVPISHDEVVHGKKSLLDKMPGDYWQKFANLRLFLAYMYAHPGKKLLFMGCEFGQYIEWKYNDSLDWHLLGYEMHNKMHEFVKVLNQFYLSSNALWEIDDSWDGFRWIEADDSEKSIVSFVRMGKSANDQIITICNFTSMVHEKYRVGVLDSGIYEKLLNTDDISYGGSGVINSNSSKAEKIPVSNMPYSFEINLPPLAAVFYKKKNGGKIAWQAKSV